MQISKSEITSLVGFLFILISYIITLGLYSRIIDKRRSKEEMVYYLSKIATVKNIVRTNHLSQIFNEFDVEGNLEGININYQRLLDLIEDNKCKKGYKKCGILDTIGNILCIDETFNCPINQLNVDLKKERNKYLNKGMKEIYNENLIYNYQFYYSNKSIDNNIVVSVLFTQSNPNYITISNFVIDTEAYEDIIGSLPSINEDNSESKNKELDKGIQDVIVGITSDVEPIAGNALKLFFSLLSFSTNRYMPNEKMQEFKKYTEERIKEEENKHDKYYINIGDNAYIKNYIGFQSLQDSETFMNFNYKNLYKKIFPSKNVITVSIIFLVIDIIFFIIQFVITYYFEEKVEAYAKDYDDCNKINENVKENETEVEINNMEDEITKQKQNDNNKEKGAKIKKENKDKNLAKTENKESLLKHVKYYLIFQFIIFLLFITINLWIMFSAIMRHSNLNEKFKVLKRIKSDEFVNNFISEFIEICNYKSSLYYASIIVSSIAMLFHLIGFILLLISLC